MKPINSTGILLKYDPSNGWVATIDFSTWEHGLESCIEGSVGSRYFRRDLTATIDHVLAAANSIGVVFHAKSEVEPCIYVEGDGEDPAIHLPPNWRQLIAAQCDRLGWRNLYQAEHQETHEAPPRVQ